jgi:uncharacterized protein (DUF1501 family)
MPYSNASQVARPGSLIERESELRSAQHSTAQLKTAFPAGMFGNAIRAAMQTLAKRDTPRARSGRDVAVIRLTLHGFDTHQNQPHQHSALLTQLAEGLVSLKTALVELGRWDRTLVMTHAEFGRSARENQRRGTDHGTVAPHFAMGARVRGSLYGVSPELARLDGSGNLPPGVDFRRLYATVLDSWWGLDASAILQQKFELLPLLRV